jgi:HprK-related kinase A
VTQVKQLPPAELRRRFDDKGLMIAIGPFATRIRTRFPDVQNYLASHYAEFPLSDSPGPHFSIAVAPPANIRRWFRPQAVFFNDGRPPFKPVPRRVAPALFEWGMNWCVGKRAQHWLMLHASVVERGGRVLLMPAPPNSGKSTLGAALAFGGWRLFSDEFGLIDASTAQVHPMPRPIALKGASIGIIRTRVPSVVYGPEAEDEDGAKAVHAAPMPDAVLRMHETAPVGWIVVPRFERDVDTILEPVPRARMLAHLADSSFNYNVVSGGFDVLARIVDGARCFRLTFGRLEDGLAALADLASEP